MASGTRFPFHQIVLEMTRTDVAAQARYLPVSKAVVCAVGPYSYYAGTTNRTAYSKLHQKVLELEGYTCMPVPYFEWSELKTEEDKMVYLWSLGRKAAGRNKKVKVSADAHPADVTDFEQSDLLDIGAQ